MLDPEPINSKKIRNALIRAVTIPAALLLILAAVFIYQTNHLLVLSRYVEHTENVLREAFETQKLILDMETGLRGYVINRDPEYLDPYLRARDEVESHLVELSRLVANDVRDVRRMAEITILTKEWREIAEHRFLKGTILESRLQPDRAKQAKIRMERIRVNFNRITRDAEALRNERRLRIETTARRSLKVGVAMAISLGLAVAFSTFGQIQLITRTFLVNLKALREAKADLQASHGLLEEKVQERTLALTAANRELEAFCYSVSHDLRSPLRGIDGFAQAVIEDYSPVLDSQGKSYLEFIRSGVQKMGRLIDDLLALSRLTRVDMKVVRVDLSEIARNIGETLNREYPKSYVDFRVESNLVANADEGLLTIALENLLANAWKFTSKKEMAVIEFGSKRTEEETVYFIRDNGAGFDMTFLDKLFGAFQRLHPFSEFEGTGIGLATVRRVILRHGGQIYAEGKVGEGATFFFTLALVPPSLDVVTH